MTRRGTCTECLGKRDCWVCDSTGSHSGAVCATCTGSGRCRRCSPAVEIPRQTVRERSTVPAER